MRRTSLLLFTLISVFLVVLSVAAGVSFTVSAEQEWKEGTLNGVTVRNDSLELETPLTTEGFETEVALEYWDFHRGSAFVPETGFTGNDAIILHNSTAVPGVGNVTQLNYSIPLGFAFQEGDEFSAWAKHNGTEDSDYRLTHRLDGSSGLIEAEVDEATETVTCRTNQEQQVFANEATPDSWYRFIYRLYPDTDTVHCTIQDNNETVIGSANLSTSIDFSRVIIRAAGDAEPMAWFDDVTIPKYRAEGVYTSPDLGNGSIYDWQQLVVDAANITNESVVDAVFLAKDSSGTVMDEQVIRLSEGQKAYPLDAPNSLDATLQLNGTTNDPSLSWSIASYTIRSNTTNVSAPSIDKPSVSPGTAETGETVTFTAELTDDDYEQNTVALWRQQNGSTTWERLNRSTITPTTVDTVVTFRNTFSSAMAGDHRFKFNTTDASGFTDETNTATFTITSSDTSEEVGGPTGSGGVGQNGTTDGSAGATVSNDTSEEPKNSVNGTEKEDTDTGENSTDTDEMNNTTKDAGPDGQFGKIEWKPIVGALLIAVVFLWILRMYHVL